MGNVSWVEIIRVERGEHFFLVVLFNIAFRQEGAMYLTSIAIPGVILPIFCQFVFNGNLFKFLFFASYIINGVEYRQRNRPF